jgi:glutamine cyclotransferase
MGSSKRTSKRAAQLPHKKRPRLATWIGVVAVLVVGLLGLLFLRESPPARNQPAGNTNAASGNARKVGYDVVASYPHDPEAYTQGLVWHDGGFFESTGLYQHSTLRRVEFPSGKVVRSISLAPDLFAEGLALADDRLIQLTWKSGRGFVYEMGSFKLLREFSYDTEGWGLTYDGKNLIMSDGSSSLFYLDPNTFRAVKRLDVTMNGSPLENLNELEYFNGEIWSNVWMTDVIVRIDPESGKVSSYLDMKGLLPANQRRDSDDVLNGIAYDSGSGRIFVGGKRWPLLFEIKLKQ